MSLGPPLLRFHVEGRPVPEGSKFGFLAKAGAACHACGKALGRPRVVIKDGNEAKLNAWRRKVGGACARRIGALGWEWPGLLDEAVWVRCSFGFVRPRAHEGRGRTWPTAKNNYGDSDKLARAVLDALTGVAYVDDSLVVELSSGKDWAPADGVWITLGLAAPSSDASRPAP